MSATITFLAVAGVVVVVLFWILRSGRIREKYVALWVIVGVAAAVLAVWPDLLFWLTRMLGFQLPANLLFFLSILLLLGVCLHLSLEASQLEDETRTLAEEITLLKERLTRVERAREDGDRAPQ